MNYHQQFLTYDLWFVTTDFMFELHYTGTNPQFPIDKLSINVFTMTCDLIKMTYDSFLAIFKLWHESYSSWFFLFFLNYIRLWINIKIYSTFSISICPLTTCQCPMTSKKKSANYYLRHDIWDIVCEIILVDWPKSTLYNTQLPMNFSFTTTTIKTLISESRYIIYDTFPMTCYTLLITHYILLDI